MLTQEWNIQARALQCAVSGRPFEKDERVYSALYWRDGQYVRVDLSEESWNARNDNIEPLSAWQADFVPPAPPPPALAAPQPAAPDGPVTPSLVSAATPKAAIRSEERRVGKEC